MCFGGSTPKPTPAPAPAPPAPDPLPTPADIGIAQRQEDQKLFGTDTPDLRRPEDAPRSNTGTTPTGGAGLRM